MEFALDPDEGLAELRSRMDELLQFLGPCRIFVAKSASGAVYFELEKAGCSVWEVSGRPDEFLDSVLKGEEEAESAAAPAVETPRARRGLARKLLHLDKGGPGKGALRQQQAGPPGVHMPGRFRCAGGGLRSRAPLDRDGSGTERICHGDRAAREERGSREACEGYGRSMRGRLLQSIRTTPATPTHGFVETTPVCPRWPQSVVLRGTAFHRVSP